jgi:hypothetical protein
MFNSSYSATFLFALLLLIGPSSTNAFNNNHHYHNKQQRRNGARGTSPSSSHMIKTQQEGRGSHTLTTLSMAPKKAAASTKKKAASKTKAAPVAPETLRKKDLVDELSSSMGITKVDADAAITKIFDIVSDVSCTFWDIILMHKRFRTEYYLMILFVCFLCTHTQTH